MEEGKGNATIQISMEAALSHSSSLVYWQWILFLCTTVYLRTRTIVPYVEDIFYLVYIQLMLVLPRNKSRPLPTLTWEMYSESLKCID